MRRCLIAVLMLPLLLLCACSGGEKNDLQAPMAFRAALLAAEELRFTADMQVDVQGKLCSFVLDCLSRADGSAEMTVRSPSSLAGIHAVWSGTSGLLDFDGMAVDFGLPEQTELAPITLPAAAAEAWRSFYLLSAGEEDGLLRATYENDRQDSAPVVDTWFDGETPVYTEISLNGSVVAELRLTDVRLNGG